MPSPHIRKRRPPHKKKPVPNDIKVSPAPPIRSATQDMERIIARIIYLRFQQDVARLFSTHLNYIVRHYLPKLFSSVMLVTSPGWLALNADSDGVKDYFRGALGMDLREAGDRVAAKSLVWSYKAIRHFAVFHGVLLCHDTGVHSQRLLPFTPQLKAHLDALERMAPPAFSRPPHLPPFSRGLKKVEKECLSRVKNTIGKMPTHWNDWRIKVETGYHRLVDTLYDVAAEFDVRGYGLMVKNKLENKWCCTDCLGDMCEKAVREEEETSGRRAGKEREWDGRGSGVPGWETEKEEDIWQHPLDFVARSNRDSLSGGRRHNQVDDEEDPLTIGELMHLRYFKAEREKELGNIAFKRNDNAKAIEHYLIADKLEGELPHYKLNLAAAYLKLSRWEEAEAACAGALCQHRSVKGYWRRAKARKMLGRPEDAAKDLQAILVLQPHNDEARAELESLFPKPPDEPAVSGPSSASALPQSSGGGNTSHFSNSAPPFEVHDLDKRKLRIKSLPMSIRLPDSEEEQSFNYPYWERYAVERYE